MKVGPWDICVKKSGTASAAFAGFSTTGAEAGTTTGAAAGAAAGHSSGPDWSHFTAVGYLTISRRRRREYRRIVTETKSRLFDYSPTIRRYSRRLRRLIVLV